MSHADIVRRPVNDCWPLGSRSACILNDGSKARPSLATAATQRLTPAEFAALVRRFVGVDVRVGHCRGSGHGDGDLDFDTLD